MKPNEYVVTKQKVKWKKNDSETRDKMNIYISVQPLTLFERYDVEFKTPTAEESNASEKERWKKNEN